MTSFLEFVLGVGEDASGMGPVLEILLRITVVLAVVMLLVLALRRTSAALRHWVWALSLVGALLLPCFYGFFPAWRWAVLPPQPSEELSSKESVTPSVANTEAVAKNTEPSAVAVSMVPSPDTQPVEPLEITATSSMVDIGTLPPGPPVEVAPPVVKKQEAPSKAAAPVSQTLSPAPSTWPWSVFLVILWVSGTSLGLLWLVVGMIGAWRIVHRAQSIEGSTWSRLLQQLVSAYKMRRPVVVRESAQISVPMTWGIRRPVILVPVGSGSWSGQTKRSVLLHELAHIRRTDCLTHLLGLVARAVYWFHPLVWLVSRQLRKTSEQAADDMVLASDIAPPDYAEQLVQIARHARRFRLIGHVALPMASRSDLERRVLAILDPRRSRRSLKRKTCYALIVLALLVLVPGALLKLSYAQATEPVVSASENADKEKKPDDSPKASDRKPEKTVRLTGRVVGTDKKKSKAPDDIFAEAVLTIKPVVLGTDGKPAKDFNSKDLSISYWAVVTKELSENFEPPFAKDWHDPATGKIWRLIEHGPVAKNQWPGEYRVQVFSEKWSGYPQPVGLSDPIVLDGSKKETEVKIHLNPTGPTLTFRAIDAETGKPIPRPKVVATCLSDSLPPDTKIFLERDESSLRMVNMPPGPYSIEATRRASNPSESDYALAKGPLKVEMVAGKDQVVTLPMRTKPLTKEEIDRRWPWIVEGRVTDEQGKPIEGVSVVANCGIGTLWKTGNTKTDKKGHYTLRFAAGIHPTLSKSEAESGAVPFMQQYAKIRAYKPGFTEKNHSRQGDRTMAYRAPKEGDPPIEKSPAPILPGKPVTIDFVMVPTATPGSPKQKKPNTIKIIDQKSWIAQGHVTDEQGKPMEGVTVTAMCGARTGSTKTGKDGRYTLQFAETIDTVPPKTIETPLDMKYVFIHADKSGFIEKNCSPQGNRTMANRLPKKGEKVLQASPDPILPGKPVTIDFVMVPTATIDAELVDAEGKPVAKPSLCITAWGKHVFLGSDKNLAPGRSHLGKIPTGSELYASVFTGSATNPLTPLTKLYSTSPMKLSKPGKYQMRLKLPPEGAKEPGRLEVLSVKNAKGEEIRDRVVVSKKDSAVDVKKTEGDLSIKPVVYRFDGKPCQKCFPHYWMAVDKDSHEDPDAGQYDWHDSATGKTWRHLKMSPVAEKLTPGEYRVVVLSSIYPGYQQPIGLSEPVRLDGSKKETQVKVHLEPGSTLTIRAIDAETGKPVPHPNVVATYESDRLPPGMKFSPNYSNKENKELKIEHLPPGPYSISAELLADSPSDELDYHLAGDPIKIEMVAGKDQVITLPMRGKRLTKKEIDKRWPWIVQGRVTDPQNQPIEGATVSANIGIGTMKTMGTTKTGKDGRYTLRFSGLLKQGIFHQEATIYVSKPGHVGKDPDYYRVVTTASRLQYVKGEKRNKKLIEPNKPLKLDFVLIPPATIEVELLDKEGKPIEKPALWIMTGSLPPEVRHTQKGAKTPSGKIRFENIDSDAVWWFYTSSESTREICSPILIFVKGGEYQIRMQIYQGPAGGDETLKVLDIKDAKGTEVRDQVVMPGKPGKKEVKNDTESQPEPTLRPSSDRPVPKELLDKMLKNNRHWLRPAPKYLSYKFTMAHSYKDDAMSYHVQYDPSGHITVDGGDSSNRPVRMDLDTFRRRVLLPKRLAVLQGVYFCGPLQYWAISPEDYASSVVQEEKINEVDALVLQIKPKEKSHEAKEALLRQMGIGCGLVQTYYGRCSYAADVVQIWVDKKTGRILREEGYCKNKFFYVTMYQDYVKTIEQGQVPRRVIVRIEGVVPWRLSDISPWVFDMKFQLLDKKIWLLKELRESQGKTKNVATALVTDVKTSRPKKPAKAMTCAKATYPKGEPRTWVYKPFPGDEKLTKEQKLFCRWDAKRFGVPNPAYWKKLSPQERTDAENRYLIQLLSDDEGKRVEAIDALVGLGSKKAVPLILQIAADRKEKNNWDRHTATRALAMLGDSSNRSAVSELVHLAYHYNWNTRQWARIGLIRLTGQKFGRDLKAWKQWWATWGGSPPISDAQVAWAYSLKLKSLLKGADSPEKQDKMDRDMIPRMRKMLGEKEPEKKTPVKPPKPVRRDPGISVVLARHVILLDGKKIVTWKEVEKMVGSPYEMPQPRLRFYGTRSYVNQESQIKGIYGEMRKLSEQSFAFNRHWYVESLSYSASERYDRIKTAKDLVPSSQRRMAGAVVDSRGRPVADAEVVLLERSLASSPSYYQFDITLKDGTLENPLNHITTRSDARGRFALYPTGTKAYIVALHPEVGFRLIKADRILSGNDEITLRPWSTLERNSNARARSLRTKVYATIGFPEVTLSQEPVDIRKTPPGKFRFTHIPAIDAKSGHRILEIQGDPHSTFEIIKITDAETKAAPTQKSSSPSEKDKLAPPHKSTTKKTSAKKTDLTPPYPARLTAFGKVIDPTGQPVAGATVYLREWSTYRISSDPCNQKLNDILATTKTDAQGAFRFDDVPAKPIPEYWLKDDPWDVVVVAKPYAIAWQHLPLRRSTKPMTITLKPEAKITGHVTDEQGKPVANADVKLHGIRSLMASDYLWPKEPETLDLQLSRLAPKAKTDAQGNVTLAGLPADRLCVMIVTHDDHRQSFALVATTDQPQPDFRCHDFVDGKLQQTEKKVYSNHFTTTLGPPFPRVTGQVVTADTRQPLAELKVMHIQGLGTHTDRQGRFTIDGIRGSLCRLLIHKPKDSTYLGQLVVVDMKKEKRDPQAREIPIRAELIRGVPVEGRVLASDTGKGVEGVYVKFDNGLDINESTKSGPVPDTAKTDSQGHFQLAVPPGKGKLRIYGFGAPLGYALPEPYVKIEAFARALDVSADHPPAPVQFTISPGEPITAAHVKTMEGTVVDPNGKPAADVEVGPYNWFHENVRKRQPVRTDKDGHFSFSVRVPSSPFDEIILVAKDKKRKLCGHLRRINFSDGKFSDLKIPLHYTGMITGHVYEGDRLINFEDPKKGSKSIGITNGCPMVKARVQLSQYIKGKNGQLTIVNRDFATTDEDGWFSFPLVEADQKVIISVVSEKHMDGTCTTQVAHGQHKELDRFCLMRLSKAVAGVVVDPEGEPLAGISVSAMTREGKSIPFAFTSDTTGKDGRFTIRGVPDVPLKLTASVRDTDSKGRTINHSNSADATPGDLNIRLKFTYGLPEDE